MNKEIKDRCKNILQLVYDLILASKKLDKDYRHKGEYDSILVFLASFEACPKERDIILKIVDFVRNLQKDIETDCDLMYIKKDHDLEGGYDTIY